MNENQKLTEEPGDSPRSSRPTGSARALLQCLDAQGINRRRALYMATHGFCEVGEPGNRSYEYMAWLSDQMGEAVKCSDSGVREMGNGLLREPHIFDHHAFNDWLEINHLPNAELKGDARKETHE